MDAYHEPDEELERAGFKSRHKGGAKPEDKGNDEEDEGLRECKQHVAPDSSSVRVSQGKLQAFAILL